MPLDRNCFHAQTFAEADEFAAGKNLSPEERLRWATEMKFRMFPNSPGTLDRTAFSMRKFSDEDS